MSLNPPNRHMACQRRGFKSKVTMNYRINQIFLKSNCKGFMSLKDLKCKHPKLAGCRPCAGGSRNARFMGVIFDDIFM